MTYLLESRSEPGQWDPSHLAAALGQWGMSPNELSVEIQPQWHLPSGREKSAIIELYRTFAEAELETLQQLIRSGAAKKANVESGAVDRDEALQQHSDSWKELGLKFCKSLLLVCKFAKTFPCLLGDETAGRYRSDDNHRTMVANNANEADEDSEDDNDGDSERNRVKIHKRRVKSAYCFQSTDDAESIEYLLDFHKRLGGLLSEVLLFFVEHRDDDIESVKLVLQVSHFPMINVVITIVMLWKVGRCLLE
jgi:hypothetical protein